MSASVSAARGEQARPAGLIATILTLPFQCFGLLCGSLLLSVLVECIGTHWFWPEQSWHHAERLLDYELRQLSSYFTQSLLLQEPGRAAVRLVERAYDLIFIKTGVLEWAHTLAAQKGTQTSATGGLRGLLGFAYVHIEVYVLAAGYTVLTCLVRLLVLVLSMPLFFLAAFVGFVDGLVRRDIRRFEAGRESAFVYHRARAALMPLSVLPWVIYLALPVSAHPLLILLPTAVLLSIATNVTVGSFKKYL